MPNRRDSKASLRAARSSRAAEYTVVRLRRLPESKRIRLVALMDKVDDCTLTALEKKELKRLGTEVDALLLANSKTLARTIRPELFDKRGRPVGPRMRRSLQMGAAASASKHDVARA